MFYLVFAVIVGVVVYVGLRSTSPHSRPRTRVIGPDDDPDFLQGLGRPDTTKH